MMKKPVRHLLELIGLSMFALTALASEPQPTHEFTLDNGLKVIVREDHRAPVVVSQLWYRVGSSDETPGRTGLSHMLEHMMFKGSRKLGPGEASRILRELGAQENAFTSDDYTAYYQILVKDRLPVALEMEADRMNFLTLPPDEFAKELEVVKEERRLRTDDQPTSLAYERFKAAAYVASGYHNPTIGWKADLDRLTIDDLKHWYQSWYAPNNATLVIVGDVSPDEMKTLAQRYFGDIPRRALPEQRKPLELPEPGERRLTLHVRTQLPSLLIGFNSPSLGSSDNAREIHALRLISALLDGGYSARFPSQLERQQELAASASASYNAFARGDSLFMITATPNVQKNVTLEQLEKGIWDQLNALKTTPPDPSELDRVRAQVIASMVYERDSIAGQAVAIGQLESVGLSWKLIDQDLEALQQVTPQDIQQAAQTYFIPSRMTLAQVLPETSSTELPQ